MLMMCLEIIATTYCSMIFKTHVFCLYSYLCIYIATHAHRVYLDWMQGQHERNSRCARRWPSTLRNTLRARNHASLENHLEAMIVRTWRSSSSEFGYTWRLWSGELSDELWAHESGRDRTCTWRSWLSEVGVHGGGWCEVCRVLELYSSIS